MGEYPRQSFTLDSLLAQRPPLPPRPLSRASSSSSSRLVMPSDEAERDAIAALSFSLPPHSHSHRLPSPPPRQPVAGPSEQVSRHRSAAAYLKSSASLDDAINSFTSAPTSTTFAWAPPPASSHPTPTPPVPTPRAKRRAPAGRVEDPDADFAPAGHRDLQSRSVSTEHDEEKRAARGRPKGVKDGPNVDKTRRGRPKGTKNVKGTKREREEREREALGLGPVEKKKRGRPAGSKNKFKEELPFGRMESEEVAPTVVESSPPPPPAPLPTLARQPSSPPPSPTPSASSSLSRSLSPQPRALPLPSRTAPRASATTAMTFLSSQEPRFRLKANVSYDRERMADELDTGETARPGYALVDEHGWATVSAER